MDVNENLTVCCEPGSDRGCDQSRWIVLLSPPFTLFGEWPVKDRKTRKVRLNHGGKQTFRSKPVGAKICKRV